jgi:hypothetical protein
VSSTDLDDDTATAIHEAAHVVAGALETPPYLYRLVVLRALRPNTGFSFAHRARQRDDPADTERDLLLTLAGPAASHRYDPNRSPQQDVTDYENAVELAERIASARATSSASVLAASEHEAFLLVAGHWGQIEVVGDVFLREQRGAQWSLDSDQIRTALVEAGVISSPAP